MVSSTSFLVSNFFDFHQDHRFGSADDDTSFSLALVALQSEGDFLGGFGFLSEDGFGLSSISGLLSVVTSSSLGSLAFLSLFVLSDLVHGVGLALTAVSLSGLGDHNHFMTINIRLFN